MRKDFGLKMNNGKFILSIFFGVHDSCVTFSSKEEISLHLEAERIFRKKHLKLDEKKMIKLIQIGLEYLSLNINFFDTFIMAKDDYENLKFDYFKKIDSQKISIFNHSFKPILVGHHLSHIGSIIPSNFGKTLIVCADGGSEDGTTKFYLKEKNQIKLLADFDNEIITGKFYGTITQMIIHPGLFKSHVTYPGKLMGLAGLGIKEKKYHLLLQKNKEEINKLHFRKNKINDLRKIFNITNEYDTPWLDTNRKNLAFTAQKYWEDTFLSFIKKYSNRAENICLTGGCALNVNLNSRIMESGLFKNIYISPISSDCGQSLGAILYCFPNIKVDYPFLGRGFGNIKTVPDQVIQDLLDHKIIAWYQGRSEVGPRSLGHRSFIGLPDSVAMKKRLSEEVKKREPYRPVSPIVLKEDVNNFFNFQGNSPFMTFAPKAKPITKKIATAIVHYDGTSRIQTILKKENPILHKILTELKNREKAPILMNSSFNIAGEPIVDTPEDALKSFKKSNADVLYINGERFFKK